MPFVYNGIGTWYYGKRRIHSLKGDCEFCHRHCDLESYDTTLFFVIVFIPIIPISKKRILKQCAVCQRHRVISKARWEEAKAKDSSAVLETLAQDPDDRDAILRAIGFAMGYQDEPLFDNIVERLASDRTDDAAIQAGLGDGYSYFSRWGEAEKAYRNSLHVDDNEFVREALAWSLLKQGRPDEAKPLLQHILDNKKAQSAGMIYYLVESFQSQGRHEDALELMDARDAAFPEFVKLKEYAKQRKTSTRYKGTEKRIASPYLNSGSAGYREGNWTSRMPYYIAALVFLGLIGAYLGTAIWKGESRKVYLVNGTHKSYSVIVRGDEYTLGPSSVTPIHVPEGDVEVAFSDEKLGIEPVHAHIHTPFWGRPFDGKTFVINPDQAALVLEENRYYAANNPRNSDPPIIHFGHEFYALPGVDYPFEPFPHTIQTKNQSELRKTGISLAPITTPELRMGLIADLRTDEFRKVCRNLLQIDPNTSSILNLLALRLTPQELIAFVEPHLADRPLRVEWHRIYQSTMEKVHPEIDLQPRYRQIVEETDKHPDAIYLLGRLDPDPAKREKSYLQAANGKPPCPFAMYGLGFHALSDGRFKEAAAWFEKALPLYNEKLFVEYLYHQALLAGGQSEKLLDALQRRPSILGQWDDRNRLLIRALAASGDEKKARQKLQEIMSQQPLGQHDQAQRQLEAVICCCKEDVQGYLKCMSFPASPMQGSTRFTVAFLQGNLKQAATLIQKSDRDEVAQRGLIYLAAKNAGDDSLAQDQLRAIIDALHDGDRDQQKLGDYLKDRGKLDQKLPLQTVMDPEVKRVLLLVLADCYPDQARDMQKLARALNFQHDEISLCLAQLDKEQGR